MRIISRFVPILLLALATVGCQTSSRIGPSSGFSKGTVVHVVLVEMYDRGDETARKELIAAGEKLEHIPGVVSVSAGPVFFSQPREIEVAFDLVYIVTFNSEDALKHYRDDPAHMKLKQEVLDRYAKVVRVYDFTAQ